VVGFGCGLWVFKGGIKGVTYDRDAVVLKSLGLGCKSLWLRFLW
jgi:hypothetical protein